MPGQHDSPPDKSLSLDDPTDDAMAETWHLLDGTAAGAIAFGEVRAQLRAIRALPTAPRDAR